MNPYEILLITFVIIGGFLCFYLYTTGRRAVKIEKELMLNDPNTTTKVEKNGMIPKVYEIVYYKRETEDQDSWVFPRKLGNNAFLVNDIQKRQINHVMINGDLYKVSLKHQDIDYYYIKMESRCDSSLPFMTCARSTVSTGNELYKVLHVLGYYI